MPPWVTTRLLIEAGAAVVLVIAFLFYRHSLIMEGEQRIKDADQRTVAAAVIHNREVETRAKTLAQVAVDDYKATIAKPPTDSPHIRLRECPSTGTGPVRPNASTGPVDHAVADVSTEMAELNQQGLDWLTDQADELTRDADAQVIALQKYVIACQDAGICAK